MKCIGERDRGALRQPPQLSGRKNINGPPPSSCALSMQKTLSAGKCEKNKNLDLIKTLSAKVHVRFVFNKKNQPNQKKNYTCLELNLIENQFKPTHFNRFGFFNYYFYFPGLIFFFSSSQ
jgi:hypothetical protein